MILVHFLIIKYQTEGFTQNFFVECKYNCECLEHLHFRSHYQKEMHGKLHGMPLRSLPSAARSLLTKKLRPLTWSPDALCRGSHPAIETFMPLPKQPVYHLSLLVNHHPLDFIHVGVPVVHLEDKQHKCFSDPILSICKMFFALEWSSAHLTHMEGCPSCFLSQEGLTNVV